MENYNFESVYFDINENDELESIRISSVDGAKKLGDYPAISLGEAEKLLLDGKYISGSADGIKDGRVTREKIKKSRARLFDRRYGQLLRAVLQILC